MRGVETRLFRVNKESFRSEELSEAGRIIAEGGLVAFPTETVYGMAANLADAGAVKRLLEVRESPEEKKLTVHLGHASDLGKWVRDVPPPARRLMRKFWPGPLTIILPLPDGTTSGFRLVEDPVGRALLRAAGVPVVAPSCNLSGQPPINDPDQIMKVFGGKIDAVVDGGPVKYGKASTVVEFLATGGHKILREGAVPADKVEKECRQRVLFICTGNTCRSPMAEGLLRRALALRAGVPEDRLAEKGWIVESAGTGAMSGSPMAANAQKVLQEMGCRVKEHRSRSLTPEMVEDADRIFTMTRAHLEQVIMMVPEAVGRSRRLDPTRDVEDPVGGDLEAYRAAARHIKKALDSVMKTL